MRGVALVGLFAAACALSAADRPLAYGQSLLHPKVAAASGDDSATALTDQTVGDVICTEQLLGYPDPQSLTEINVQTGVMSGPAQVSVKKHCVQTHDDDDACTYISHTFTYRSASEGRDPGGFAMFEFRVLAYDGQEPGLPLPETARRYSFTYSPRAPEHPIAIRACAHMAAPQPLPSIQR